VELHQPAPDFTLPDLEGQTHCLHHYRGRIVILNFWSAECPQCQRVDLALSACLREWNGRVILLTLAANVNETQEAISTAALQRGLTPVLLANHTPVPEEYGAQTTPHLFVVDGSGILRYRGAFDDLSFRHRNPMKSYLKDAVEALLAGHLPEVAETAPYGCTIMRFVLE
jgi:peroxiredoxin